MSLLLRKHIEKYTSLSDEEFEYILSHFTLKKLKKHQFLVQVGESVPCDFLVVKGCLKAYHTDSEDKDHILQFAMEDWWVTDYQAYFNETLATISVDCIEDCELLALSLHNREKLCSELHKIEHFFRRKSNSGYIALQQRILSLLNNSAGERFEQFNKLYPQLQQRIPKQLIAAYLGVSRETLSRLNSK